MRAVMEGKSGQNVMSYYGLEFVKDVGRPYITIGSIRNVSQVSGETLKIAMKKIRARQHRILLHRGDRKFHTTCIRLKDLPALNTALGNKIDNLVEDLLNEYRNLL